MNGLIGTCLILMALCLLAVLLHRILKGKGQWQAGRIGDGLRQLDYGKAKYARMTAELLDSTPDEELLAAVLSGLWAKMAPDLSDALAIMAGQTLPRRQVYAIYHVNGTVGLKGFASVLEGDEAAFLPDCMSGLHAMGAEHSAALLGAAMAGGGDAYSEGYLDAFAGEDGKGKMVAFIRANASAFLDAEGSLPIDNG